MLSSYFTIFMPNCLKKTFKLKFDSCQIFYLIVHPNNLSWRNSRLLKSVWILGGNAVKLQVWKKNPLTWFLNWKTSHWYEFYPFYLSFSSILWHKCQRVSHPAALHQFMQRMLGDLTHFCVAAEQIRGWNYCLAPFYLHGLTLPPA